MDQAETHPDYPPEEGCYIRGNDRSPVAVDGKLEYLGEAPTMERLLAELQKVSVEGKKEMP